MRLHADQPIHERVRILEEALAQCLDIDATMCVDAAYDGTPDQYVWVLEKPYDEVRTGHRLDQIARDLEKLLT